MTFEPVHLDFESGTFDGWSVKRLSAEHSAMIQSDRAAGEARLPLRAAPGGLCQPGPPRRASRPLQRRLGRGGLVRIFDAARRGFRTCRTCRLRFAQWHDQAKLGDPSGKPPIAIRYRGGRLFVTGAYGRVASPEPDIRYEFASIADFPHGVWHDFVFRVFWSRHGASEIEAWLNGEEDHRLARAARLRERGGGAVFQARRLLVAGRHKTDRRLSRQLQPRTFVRGGRSVGRRMAGANDVG